MGQLTINLVGNQAGAGYKQESLGLITLPWTIHKQWSEPWTFRENGKYKWPLSLLGGGDLEESKFKILNEVINPATAESEPVPILTLVRVHYYQSYIYYNRGLRVK